MILDCCGAFHLNIVLRSGAPVPRGGRVPANIALMGSRVAHRIAQYVEGKLVLGRPGTRSASALPHIEPTRVHAQCLLFKKP